ncbi:hypothetical protein SAMN05421751_101309 [Jhaorihella thermophila]|uniref:Uncharacterized protein n=1 Tax=Jhaorihella thermophila TaxID=488547 RepID=A0A1H5S2S1_9RHOB|nr:hypothetical protein SAMN05421751_101309 [Jhaorihella thermophila]
MFRIGGADPAGARGRCPLALPRSISGKMKKREGADGADWRDAGCQPWLEAVTGDTICQLPSS